MAYCLIDNAGICEIGSTEKFSAIRELILKTALFQELPDPVRFEKQVMDREMIQTTGFGRGIAIAHGSSSEISSLAIALGISKTGIEYDALDGKPVHILFLVANPPEARIEYLSALSTLVRLLREKAFRDEILLCETPGEMKILIKKMFHELHQQHSRLTSFHCEQTH